MTTSTTSSRRLWYRFASSIAALTLAGSMAACSASDSTTGAGADPVASSSSTSTASSTATASGSTAADSATTDSATTDSATTDSAATTAETVIGTAAAAEAFLATLTAEQQEQVLYSYDDATKTTSWSNFPVTFVERAGLNLTDLTEEQQTAALGVLESLLSDEAYATIEGIMNGDRFLLENSTNTAHSLASLPTPVPGRFSSVATTWASTPPSTARRTPSLSPQPTSGPSRLRTRPPSVPRSSLWPACTRRHLPSTTA
jgi:hypothetical protein